METKIENKYGKEIRSIRAYLGMTQSEMAAELGITSVTLSSYERGVTVPDVLTWERIRDMRDYNGIG